MDKKNVPNESEAIRASGNFFSLTQNKSQNADKKYVNNYIQYSVKPNKINRDFEEENKHNISVNESNASQVASEANLQRYGTNNSSNKPKVSNQSYSTNPFEMSKNYQRHRQSLQNVYDPNLFDFNECMSEDIEDDQNEGTRKIPYTLQSINNENKLLDIINESSIIFEKQESVNSSQLAQEIKERQSEVESKLEFIQRQVEQQQQELDEFRKRNKFQGVNKDLFKPFNQRTDKFGITDEEREQIIKLADKSGKPLMRPEAMLLYRRNNARATIAELEEMIIQREKNLQTSVPVPTMMSPSDITDKDYFKETQGMVYDEHSPVDQNDKEFKQRQHSINVTVSQFIPTGGGLQQYVQQSQYSSRSYITKNEINQQSPQAATTYRDKFIGNNFEVETPQSTKHGPGRLQRNSSKQDVLMHSDDLEQVVGKYINSRDQNIQSALPKVQIHPQDMKRMGLNLDQNQTLHMSRHVAVKSNTLQKCTSTKSLKSNENSIQTNLKTDRDQKYLNSIPKKSSQHIKKSSPNPDSKQDNNGSINQSGKTRKSQKQTKLSHSFLSNAEKDLKKSTTNVLAKPKFNKVDEMITKAKSKDLKKQPSPKPMHLSIKQNERDAEIAIQARKSITTQHKEATHKKIKSKNAFDIIDGLKPPQSTEMPLDLGNLEQSEMFPQFDTSEHDNEQYEKYNRPSAESGKQESIEDKFNNILNELAENAENQNQGSRQHNIFESKSNTIKRFQGITNDEIESLLKQLIEIEKHWYSFLTSPFENLQQVENRRFKAANAEPDLKTILQKAGIDKIRVLFFVRQMQITFILAKAFVRVFPHSLLQRFQVKLQNIYQNVHQNLLLTINMVLRNLYSDGQTFENTIREHYSARDRSNSFSRTNSYRLLKNLIEDKLRSKEKQAKTLTSFRQNNEVNIQSLKKLIKYLLESYNNESVNLKGLAEDIQEIMRKQLNNAIANQNVKNFEQQVNLPTSQIEFIEKQIMQRCEQVLSAPYNVGMQNEAMSAKKRHKSNIKVFSPDKQSQNRAQQLVNSTLLHNKSVIEETKQPTRINDLIDAANQGKNSGILAQRKSAKKQKPSNQLENEDQTVSPLGGSFINNSFIFPEKKRCGSSNMVFDNARPSSPSLVLKTESQPTRKKFQPGKPNLQSSSALGQLSASQAKRMQIQQSQTTTNKGMVTKQQSLPVKQKEIQTSAYTSPIKSANKKLSISSVKHSSSKMSAVPQSTESKKTNKQQSLIIKKQQILSQKSQDPNANWVSHSFSLPETLAFIQDQMKNQSIVNNNINIYGPVMNYVMPQSSAMSPSAFYQHEDEDQILDYDEEEEHEDEMKEFNLLDQIRKKTTDENVIESHQSSQFKLMVPKVGTANRKTYESQLKPPSRQRDMSPRLTEFEIQEHQIVSPLKTSQVKTGIGSGIKNLKTIQQTKRKTLSISMVSDQSLLVSQRQESDKPPEPEQLQQFKPVINLESNELDEFEQIEAEIFSQSNSKGVLMFDMFKPLQNNNLKQCESPEKTSPKQVEKKFQSFDEINPRSEVTEPRRFKKRTETQQLYSNQNTIPRKRMSKKYFIGEYDATAEEEQSLFISHSPGKNERAKVKTYGAPGEISQFVHSQKSSISPELSKQQSRKDSSGENSQHGQSIQNMNLPQLSLLNNNQLDDNLLSSHRISVIDHFAENENAVDEIENKPINMPSEIKLSDSRKTDNKIMETLRSLNLPNKAQNQQLDEYDDEYEQTQTLTIVPQNMVNKPQEQIEEQAQMTEQDEIDLEWRQLREKVTYPFLPPLNQSKKLPKYAKDLSEVYTLVLDLDETLIHFEIDETIEDDDEAGYYNIRPGAIRFLSVLSDYFEIVVFTAAMPDYADWILDDIDRAGKISHRLYRQHTTPHEDYAIKDIKNLGRDLSRIIIIDNLAENFNFTSPLNGIWVESWYDDMDDNILGLLIPFLKQIVELQVDVRQLLTEQLKEQYLYKHLDEQKQIPPVGYLMSRGRLSQMEEAFDSMAEFTKQKYLD